MKIKKQAFFKKNSVFSPDIANKAENRDYSQGSSSNSQTRPPPGMFRHTSMHFQFKANKNK
jgi:hypothetical protein